MISYGEFLWGNLIGISYGAFLWGFQMGWAGKTGLGRLGWDVMGFQSTVENPDKISQ